jgi:DNA repair ATPase RecN
LAEKRALKNTKILNLKNQNEWLETLEEEIRSIFRKNNLEKWDKIDTKVKKISENIEKIEKNLNDKLSLVTKISSEMEMVAKDWKELTVEFEKINELWEKWECPTCFRALEDYAPKILA